ncbi:MAG: cation-translocating P-type ATPase [Candidatus Aenigmarchaeota archaeon]|nr:cation-translocating P-type ATPase [Candidatus Aenigmarchaeota archaeon]
MDSPTKAISQPDISWHALGFEDALGKLGSTPKGLSQPEAERRLLQYGFNELQQEKPKSKIRIFIEQFRELLVIILIAAAVISFAVGEFIDAAVIIVIVILDGILGFVQEYRAEKAIEALKKLTSPETIVIRDGKEQKILSKQLVPGDIVALEEGSRVPADLRLIEVVSLKIDESSLTGESFPVEKKPDVFSEDTPLADRKNLAFMSSIVTFGRGKGVVIGTGMHTEIGRIAHLIQSTVDEPTPLQKKLAVFGKHLTYIILGIIAIVIALGILRGNPIIDMFIAGIALAVAAIPEGLPAIVTITLALGLQKLTKRNAIVRKLPAVETLGSVSVICSDKTGTLTKDEMTITRIYCNSQKILVTGKGYETHGSFYQDKKIMDAANDRQLRMLLSYGTLCNNAKLDGSTLIGDPTEGAIVVAASKAGITRELIESQYPRIGEVPFSSERKMMTTVHKSGKSFLVCSKGAPEIMLEKCDRIYDSGKVQKLTPALTKKMLDLNLEMTGRALRVLAVTYNETPERPKEPEEGLIFLGLVGMIDPPREGVKEEIARCREAGIKAVMITGDHKNTAVAVAKQIGMIQDGSDSVLTGAELEKISEDELVKMVEDIHVYARVNPEQKVKILSAFKKRNHIVAMTGDGVNDAPALKRADIGVAMGIKGTDVAKEASDMVLADDNFASIVAAVEGGRHIYDNINKFIRYLLTSNTGEVLIIFLGMLLGMPLPLVAIQLLWVNLVTDGLPALALGVDPAGRDIMKRPPRNPKEHILSRDMAIAIVMIAGMMAAGVLWIFYTTLVDQGWTPGTPIFLSGPNQSPDWLIHAYKYALTMSFTAVVVFEMFNVFNHRNLKGTLIAAGGPLANRKLVLAVLISFGLQLIVIYIPALDAIFETVELSLNDWIKILSVSFAALVVFQMKQFITSRKRSKSS